MLYVISNTQMENGEIKMVAHLHRIECANGGSSIRKGVKLTVTGKLGLTLKQSVNGGVNGVLRAVEWLRTDFCS